MAKAKRKNNALKTALVFGLCASVAGTAGISSLHTASAAGLGVATDGKYYAEYDTYADAQAAAREIGLEIAAQGQVLLKNQNSALPMAGTEFVSVFGVAQDAPAGYNARGTGANQFTQLTDALESEGFRVNRALESYYTGVGTTFGTETMDFGKSVEQSYNIYSDAAIVVLGRGGGEGSDQVTITNQKANDEEENDLDGDGTADWEHEGYLKGTLHAGKEIEGYTRAATATGIDPDEDGDYYKHFLQMTDSEVELLNYVKKQGFKKIIYLINSSEILEMYNLEHDKDVDGILWVGRPGAVGMEAAAKILAGKVNPSGKTADTWYTDFTADPIWYNSINNFQVGSNIGYQLEDGTKLDYSGIDYEEDIYVGYRYYETKAYDMNTKGTSGSGDAWYKKAVVYPFGYGLSYTSFKYNNMKVTEVGGSAVNGAVDGTKWASSKGSPAKVKELSVTVDVTNEGKVAGRETVEIYVQAPYTKSGIEKSHVKLVGFGKTDLLQPGAKQTVTIKVNVQDLASYDAENKNGNNFNGYELDAGNYTLMATADAHGWADTTDDRYQAVNFSLASGVTMALDDFSDNEIQNLFSKENGMYYGVRDNSDGVKYQFNADKTANMTRMTRADEDGFVKSFPKAPTVKDLTITNEAMNSLRYWDNFKVGAEIKSGTNDTENLTVGDPAAAWQFDSTLIAAGTKYADGQKIEGIVDEDDFVWLKDVKANEERMKGWDQTGEYGIMLSEMAGIDPYGTETIEGGKFDGKTGAQAWDMFMNTLSWNDCVRVVGQLQKSAFAEIGMNALSASDNATNYSGAFYFACNVCLASTWNDDLALKKGLIVGDMALLSNKNCFWGGSANTHRSPFAGRVFEYFSEDGILSGYMGAGEQLGYNTKGVVTYMKHCALNDQETNRNGRNLMAWVSEQAVREIYFKSFQIAAQEGQSSAVMGAFARMGRSSISANYQFVQALFRDEWGCSTISFTTDAYSGGKKGNPVDLIVRAGTDTIDKDTASGTWDAEKKAVMVDGEAGATQWYAVRHCAMTFLYAHANSAMNKNGVSTTAFAAAATVNATQGTAVTENLGSIVADSVTYAITSGTLPAGLSLNASTGALTGTPTAVADATVTISATADGWVTASKRVTITVASAFTIDKTAGKVGEAFSAEIDSDSLTLDSATITATGLPAGLSIDEYGVISGTPEEAGNFDVTVNVAIRSGNRTTTYPFNITLEIAAGEGSVEPSVEDLTVAKVQELIDAAIEKLDIPAAGLTEAQVKAIVNEVVADLDVSGDGVTETEAKAIVDAAIAKLDIPAAGLTEAQVKAIVDAAVADSDNGGCGSSVASTGTLLLVIAALGACALTLGLRKKEN